MNHFEKAKITLVFVLFGCLIYQKSNAQESILTTVSDLYINKLIATAKENYPRIKNLTSQLNAAKSDLAGTKTSWLEPFSFQYVARSNNSQANLIDVTTQDILTGYQFGISINPGSLLNKPSQIKRAKEQVKIAMYNQDEYNLTLESEVKIRYYTYLQTQKSLKSINDAYLDAESNLKTIRLAYQKAEVMLQEFNNASTNFSQAYASKLQSEVNYMSAKASLEELTVKKLEEIK